MLEVLAPLRQQILSIPNVWDDHNDLRTILDVIDMILSLPSSIPLAKVMINDRLDSHFYAGLVF